MHILTDDQLAGIIKTAIEKAASQTTQDTRLEEKPPAIRDLLTLHQLCGIFNRDRRAVEAMGIPRVVLAPGEYRYDPTDVEEFIASRKEKPSK